MPHNTAPANPAPDWVAIRRRYEETDDRVQVICAAASITASQLKNAAARGKWRRQKPRPFRSPQQTAASKIASPAPTDSEATPFTPPSTTPATGRQKATDRPNISRAAPRTATPVIVPLPSMGKGQGWGDDAGAVAESRPDADQAPAVFDEPTARTPTSIRRRVPSTAAGRRRLLDRLVAAISLKLEQLERRMTDDLAALEAGVAATSTDHERETRAIGALIDNLGKITEIYADLDRPAGAKRGDPVASTTVADEADRCRRELAERLARLVEAAPKDA